MRSLLTRVAQEERGSVFLASVMLLAVMTLLGAALFDLASIEAALSTADTAWNQLLYCANGALTRVMIDTSTAPAGRMTQIVNALATPGASITWGPETLSTGTFSGFTCRNTTVFFDDTSTTPPRRFLQATSTAPHGTQRTVRIQLNFTAPSFGYAASGQADFMIGGSGGIPRAGGGPGGGDIVNGDIFVGSGRVFAGTPSAPDAAGVASTACIDAGHACSSTAQINPRDTTDSNPTICVPTGSPVDTGRSPTTARRGPASGLAQCPSADNQPFAKVTPVPAPDVQGYVNQIMTTVGLVENGSPSAGNMTGTFQGSPVYNLTKIFNVLGRNSSDGTLNLPSGCGCTGVSTNQNCVVYCQLKPLGIMQNPQQGNYGPASNTTPEPDYFINGVYTSSVEQCKSGSGGSGFTCGYTSPGVTGVNGAKSLTDFRGVSGSAPILIADGNMWFNDDNSFGFRVNGRALVVATKDVYISDNILYSNGIGPKSVPRPALVPLGCAAGAGATNPACDPARADMLGIIAKRDIWYGDPLHATFHEGSAIMLAGRDFNYVFFDGTNTPKTPDGPFILNGTMLANRQIAVLRDFAQPIEANRGTACPKASTGCLPIAFDPVDVSCGSASGCWRFLVRDVITGVISYDTTKPSFKECGSNFGTCPAGSRRITHFQMSLNYDPRLYAKDSPLQPPGLSVQLLTSTSPGQVIKFANSWKSWQICTGPNAPPVGGGTDQCQ